MGINSQGVSYDFGQLGSAYTDVAKPVVPPQGMVIVAITFLSSSGCTPTVLTPEKLDSRGPGYVSISGTDSDRVGVADLYMNFHGITVANCDTTATYPAGTAVSIAAASGTQDHSLIKVGQYVLLVNDADDEDNGITIDTDTPTPIYTGPNKRGVYVTGIAANGDPILSAEISPTTSQSLIFLGPQQGAGGITAKDANYPGGLTIYGRWTEFQTQAGRAAICYFGY